MLKKSVISLALGLSAAAAGQAALGAAFTAGDLVVYRVGTGTGSLGSAATAVFLDEYTTGGALVQSIALPTAAAGGNNILTASGTATSEGLLNLSTDGHFLTLTGYAAAPGTASVAGTTAASTPRVVGLVNNAGTVNTTTALTDVADQNNPRSAITTTGTDLWVGGAAGGVRYTTVGSTTSTQLSTTVTNIRDVSIAGGQLYVSTNSGSAVRLGAVGSGTPTTSGQTIANLPGFLTSTGSPYQFFFADLSAAVAGVDTLYVADDSSTANGGGIQKWSLSGGTWAKVGTVTASNARGLTGSVSGSTVTLYATNGASVLSFTDSTGYGGAVSGSATSIATAATNTAIRGIAFAPTASISASVSPATGADLKPVNNDKVTITISGGSGTLSPGATTGAGWSFTGLPSGSFNSNQTGTPTLNTAGRLNGNVRGRTSFSISGGTPADGAYAYTFTQNVSGQSAAPGSGTSFGAPQTGTRLTGDTLTGLSSTSTGQLGTVLSFLNSSALTADTTVSVSWRNPSTLETAPTGQQPPLPALILGLDSDVARVDVGANGPTLYVVQMSYDPSPFGGNDGTAVLANRLYLARTDSNADGSASFQWGNAGDTGAFTTSAARLGAYDNNLTLGNWGVDTGNHVAWAVVTGNGQFAVVPEPASLGLLSLGAVALLRRRNAR